MPKFVKRIVESNGCVRYICPHCGTTLVISDESAPFDLPEVCGHCGRDVYFMLNDWEVSDNDKPKRLP